MGADQFWAMIEASRRGPALATRLKRNAQAVNDSVQKPRSPC